MPQPKEAANKINQSESLGRMMFKEDAERLSCRGGANSFKHRRTSHDEKHPDPSGLASNDLLGIVSEQGLIVDDGRHTMFKFKFRNLLRYGVIRFLNISDISLPRFYLVNSGPAIVFDKEFVLRPQS